MTIQLHPVDLLTDLADELLQYSNEFKADAQDDSLDINTRRIAINRASKLISFAKRTADIALTITKQNFEESL